MEVSIQNFYDKSSKSSMKEKQVSGTKEWASQTVNLVSGCVHDCKYCYAKSMAVRFKRKTPATWRNETVVCRLLKAVPPPSKDGGLTMFPSSHDITLDNLGHAVIKINLLLEGGHRLLMVTKPQLFVIQEINRLFSDRKDQILFRFTIGSTDSATLKFWEPYAPSFEERLSALQYTYSAGYNTSVSCEPALDTDTEQLIEMLLPYVTDAIWVGLPNRLKGILKLNGADDPETLSRAEDLMKAQSREWVMQLYDKYRYNPKIKWKDSIKKIVGLDRTTLVGLDI